MNELYNMKGKIMNKYMIIFGLVLSLIAGCGSKSENKSAEIVLNKFNAACVQIKLPVVLVS